MNLGPLADMHPVEQAIRDYVTGDPDICDSATAVLAVLDLHCCRPAGAWPYRTCGYCVDHEYPCETVQAVADALGVTP